MTPITMTQEDFAGLGAPALVYVRAIKAAEVLADTPDTTVSELEILPDQILFAVHGADGQRLAVLMDRESAFAAAEANELEPVSVH